MMIRKYGRDIAPRPYRSGLMLHSYPVVLDYKGENGGKKILFMTCNQRFPNTKYTKSDVSGGESTMLRPINDRSVRLTFSTK